MATRAQMKPTESAGEPDIRLLEADWAEAIAEAVGRWGTPLYLVDLRRLGAVATRLVSTLGQRPVRHFYSFKTLPLVPAVRLWSNLGLDVEVVSEFEYRAARRAGVPAQRILANGPRKVDWFGTLDGGGWVHVDSLREARSLAELAPSLGPAGVGIRVAVAAMKDPNDARYSGQFGLTWAEVEEALALFERKGVAVTNVHFHLRSAVPTVAHYADAVGEVLRHCRRLGWYPAVLDIGGGAPAQGEVPRSSGKVEWGMRDLDAALSAAFEREGEWVREIWTENGRAVTASCAMLVTRVSEVKQNCGCRYLICDGGKVNNAMPANWERHTFSFLPHQENPRVHTAICGPTCQAWDWLERGGFPETVAVGDLVVWRDAGAYHLPFETAFSHPLASVAAVGLDGTLSLCRERQTFDDWYARIGGEASPVQGKTRS